MTLRSKSSCGQVRIGFPLFGAWNHNNTVMLGYETERIFMGNNSKRYEIDMCNGTLLDKLISFSLPRMLSGIVPVSYTHLDVYKRQGGTGNAADAGNYSHPER